MDAIQIYRTYIEKLITADITPIVGLYDWDLPRVVNRELG
jgi:beta-glucosidase/6-phospho-beta-glucosidase/beta-galactosidase